MTLHVHEAGDPAGPPVLAIHGVVGHGLRFRLLSDALPGLRWVAVDLRGHGRSPWVPPWNLEQHVIDALDVLDALGIERSSVVGHSFGAAIALHLARTAPERIDRLVLLDPALGLDPQAMLRAAEDTRDDESFSSPEHAREVMAGDWTGVDAVLVDREITDNLQWRGGAFRWRYSRASVVAAWSEMARPAVVPPPGVPTLIVPALRAGLVSDDWLTACRAGPEADVTVSAVDSGHNVHLERPDEVAELLGGFLRPY